MTNHPLSFKKIIGVSLVVVIILTLFFFGYYSIKKYKIKWQNEINYYQEIKIIEQSWILENQLSNGAFPFGEKRDGIVNIVPYFSDTAARALLKDKTNQNIIAVKKYMDWHLSHLNTKDTDLYGIDGTIYDYSILIKDGEIIKEESKEKYDSVDSYAATFIMVVWEYYDSTQDSDYLLEHKTDIFRVINAMLSCMDDDGLSYVKEGNRIKYLMDNAEVNLGLKNAKTLIQEVYLKKLNKESDEYQQARILNDAIKDWLAKNSSAIDEILWNEQDGHFEVGLDERNAVFPFTGWDNFYPDGVAQVFPITFNVNDSNQRRSKKLYQRFCQDYDWENFDHVVNGDTDFYWGILSYTGAIMQDENRVKIYTENYKNTLMEDHAYPLYIGDSAWVILSCDKMIDYYEKSLLTIDPLNMIK
jgi:hypothetical protein